MSLSFIAFDPFNSFAKSSDGIKQGRFFTTENTLSYDGWGGAEETRSFWRTGLVAYTRISKKIGFEPTADHFISLANELCELEESILPALQNISIRIATPENPESFISLDTKLVETTGNITRIVAEIFSRMIANGGNANDFPDMEVLLLVLAIFSIDDCIIADHIGRKLDEAMYELHDYVERANSYQQVTVIAGSHAKAMAKKGAAARLATDPKQAAKAEIKLLWSQWQDGRASFKSGAAFAFHAVNQFPDIESVKVVERWATAWLKEKRNTHSAS